MKLKKYIVAGLIGIVSLGSCTYLDKEPDTEIDIDMVFENKTKVDAVSSATMKKTKFQRPTRAPKRTAGPASPYTVRRYGPKTR